MMNRSENDILAAIGEYLKAKGYFFWRQNTMATWDAKRCIHRKMPKFSINGVSDILLVKKGKLICIEVKRPKAKQSNSQVDFEAKIVQNDGVYFVATGVEDVINQGL